MTPGWDPEEPLADDEPLGRPFLARPEVTHPGPPAGWPARPEPSTGRELVPMSGAGRYERHDTGPPAEPAGHHAEVRPYLLTGGRTQSRGTAVAMETIVLASGLRPVRVQDAAGQERLSIVQLAGRPCSTAEVAAWLHLPLQVALVLVSDLVAEGLLHASRVTTNQSDDVHFLERLIAGVAAL